MINYLLVFIICIFSYSSVQAASEKCDTIKFLNTSYRADADKNEMHLKVLVCSTLSSDSLESFYGSKNSKSKLIFLCTINRLQEVTIDKIFFTDGEARTDITKYSQFFRVRFIDYYFFPKEHNTYKFSLSYTIKS